MNSITVSAPAKVNLFLKVLSKRKDSYHNIITLFERISLADKIRISKIPKGIIVKSDVPVTRRMKDNLAYKAAEAVLKRGGITSGVKIEIKKRIPVAAGLGGGSSDAAAVLKGVNALYRLKLADKTLLQLGEKLGADVPFFLMNESFAIGSGKGCGLSAVKSPLRLWHLLIYPAFKVSTKDVYEAFDKHLTTRCRNDKIQALSLRLAGAVRRSQRDDTYLTKEKRFGEGGISPSNLRLDYDEAESMLYNDLEPAAIMKKAVLGGILKGLAHLLGKNAIVSGSGPSLFCLYGTRKEAVRAKTRVLRGVPERRRRGWQIFIVETLKI